MIHNPRVPVVSKDNAPLMPTKASRARKLIKSDQAIGKRTKTGIFYIQLKFDPRNSEDGTEIEVQPIVVGLDRGKCFTGVAAQSKKETIVAQHVVVPGFGKTKRKVRKNGEKYGVVDKQSITGKLENRTALRRSRRGRRIDRTVPKEKLGFRSHRQARFSNRKQRKMPPSVRANHLLAIRIIKEMSQVIPIAEIRDEDCGTRTSNTKSGISPLTTGQNWLRSELSKIAPVVPVDYRTTGMMRDRLELTKNKTNKSEQTMETHANDAISLAATYFTRYQEWQDHSSRGHQWVGEVKITECPFVVVTKPRLFRRQLHNANHSKGGVRTAKGGTVLPFKGLRCGDYVEGVKAGRVTRGYVGGWTNTEKTQNIAVYDLNWRNRIQFTPNNVTLLARSTHLCLKY